MNSFKISMLLVPIVALLLVVFLYLFLLKKTSKIAFKSFLLRVSIIAFLLNLAWDLLQLPQYKGGYYNIRHVINCALATVADVIMVLLIYLGLAFIYKKPLWTKEFTGPRILTVVVIGCFVTVLAEMRHTIKGNWAYASTMPIVPFVEVGLSPLLQFMILPPIIYYTSSKVSTL